MPPWDPVLFCRLGTQGSAQKHTDRDSQSDQDGDRHAQRLGEPGECPLGKEHTAGMAPEEEADAKPSKAEKENEGCKGCSKLRHEPGAGSRGQLVR